MNCFLCIELSPVQTPKQSIAVLKRGGGCQCCQYTRLIHTDLAVSRVVEADAQLHKAPVYTKCGLGHAGISVAYTCYWVVVFIC